jgi:type-F conjugative transfer system protein TrbI
MLKMKRINPLSGVLLGLSSLALILSMVALLSGANETIVMYSPQKTVTAFSEELAHAKSLSSTQKQQLIRRFSTQLDVAIKTYAKENHAVILSASQVLAGGHNVTNIINTTLAHNMQSSEANHE